MPVSGVGVAAVSTGLLLTWAGLRGVSPLSVARDIISGQGIGTIPVTNIPNVPGFSTSNPGQYGTLGAAIEGLAVQYLGTPYVWGGATPQGWDCSGMVTYILKTLGVKLPSSTHTTSQQFLVWAGATTLPPAGDVYNPTNIPPGCLVCWPTHIGIYNNSADGGTMIGAQNPTYGTVVTGIKDGGVPGVKPLYRAVNGSGNSADIRVTGSASAGGVVTA